MCTASMIGVMSYPNSILDPGADSQEAVDGRFQKTTHLGDIVTYYYGLGFR
jgi:hypothetical protein